MKTKTKQYDGWELEHFDSSKNFRNYQLSLINSYIKGSVAEVGPGKGVNVKNYLHKCLTVDLYEPDKKLFLI